MRSLFDDDLLINDEVRDAEPAATAPAPSVQRNRNAR